MFLLTMDFLIIADMLQKQFHYFIERSKYLILRTFCRFTANQAEIRKKYVLDNVRYFLGLLHSENDFSGISTEKSLYQNVEKHHFSAYSTRLLIPEAKIKKSSHLIKFRQFYGFSPNLKIFRYRILVSLNKAEGLVFNRG